MDVKLCRICGKLDENYIYIFKTEGLKNKIETCLPIVINPHSLLPDTICNCCRESVDNFYSFIKNCLQNIIVLEAQYEIIDSCLKTKRKKDKSVCVSESDFCDLINKTEVKDSDYVKSCLKISSSDNSVLRSTKNDTPIPNFSCSLVDYDYSDTNSDLDDFDQKNRVKNEYKTESQSVLSKNHNTQKLTACDIISEIKQRKYLKRKINEILPNLTKTTRVETETSSRRKNKQPKKVEYYLETKVEPILPFEDSCCLPEPQKYVENVLNEKLDGLSCQILSQTPSLVLESLQSCLLCEQQFYGPVLLTAHMYETHGIDLAQVFQQNQSSNQNSSPKKKIPELVKISDVLPVKKQILPEIYEEPAILEPENSISNLQSVTINSFKNLTCTECSNGVIYPTFKEFSSHRRSQHQIFHCDLCLKYYGRNSHLWKHVNRVHKGHPSITCRLCNKTSASKYHLSQHFTKMHSVKKSVETFEKTPSELNPDEEFINKKFDGFDFQSVRQSFLIQDLIEKKSKTESAKEKVKVETRKIELKRNLDIKNAPKEIDSTSNLYTNIITNYTPPPNEGSHKCPKCFKSFYKKNLLKKHKKNCRPRLQKDLLTRCKTCSRIFKDRQSLTKHLINYHSEYTCEICSLAVQSKCEIVSHIRFCHPDSELVCYCGQILRSKNDLVKHKMDHKDTHVCQFCGDLLPTKIKLKMHILSLHRKILSLSCGICLKLFETQQILKDHVRLIHFDQLSPLTSCTVCGKNYGSKWKTFDHLNKSHGRIFKACKTCLEVFETEGELQKHFEEEHLNQNQKTGTEKKIENANPKRNDNFQEEENSSHSENNPASEILNQKNLQKDLNYRNYIIREYQSTLNSKKSNLNNLTVMFTNSKKIQNKNKISLLEKRLLSKKIFKKDKNKLKLQNGMKMIMKSDKFEEDPIQNSSKRTVYVNSNDPSLCEICFKVWPAKKHLWQHYIRCHKQVAATVCGICLKTNPSYSALQVHLRENHPNLLHGCGFGSNFICKICGRYHNASSKLKLHMAIHVGFNENVLYETKYENISSQLFSDNYETKPENLKIDIKEEAIQDINYEQMIEEVEYSNSDDDFNMTATSTHNYDITPNNEENNEISNSDGEFEDPQIDGTSKNYNSTSKYKEKNEFLNSDDDFESEEHEQLAESYLTFTKNGVTSKKIYENDYSSNSDDYASENPQINEIPSKIQASDESSNSDADYDIKGQVANKKNVRTSENHENSEDSNSEDDSNPRNSQMKDITLKIQENEYKNSNKDLKSSHHQIEHNSRNLKLQNNENEILTSDVEYQNVQKLNSKEEKSFPNSEKESVEKNGLHLVQNDNKSIASNCDLDIIDFGNSEKNNFEYNISNGEPEYTETVYDNEIIYDENPFSMDSKENLGSDNENLTDSETVNVENNLEREMLKNMLGENVIVTKQNLILDDSSNSQNQEIIWTNSPDRTNKELDNAIKSISYNEIDVLTETELETAVDSIL